MPKVYELEKNGRFMSLSSNFVTPEVADSELDGFNSVTDWYLNKVTTIHFILLFPYVGLWPTRERLSSFEIDYFRTTNIPLELLNDHGLVFWPQEISNCNLRRDNDVVIGKEKKSTTTISYLEEVKDYVLNLYQESRLDYCFYFLVTDVHFERAKRDFVLVMSNVQSHRVLFIPYIIKTTGLPTHSRFLLKEKVILLVSSVYPSLYVWASKRKGGLR